MIVGVTTKRLKIIPDDRGFLMEMLRRDDEIFEGFGQVYITGCKMGHAKGWHYHKMQVDHFVCVSGKALVVLYDQRSDSKSLGEVQEFILGAYPCNATEAMIVKIPPFVIHGFTALDCDEARIVNIPTIPYKYDNPDEYRLPWNSKEIPYIWPEYVKAGG